MTRTTRRTGIAVSLVLLLAGVWVAHDRHLGAQALPPMPRDPKPARPAAAGETAPAGEEARLQQRLAADPADIQTLQALAALYNRTGRFDQAIQSLERVAALRPADAEAHHVVATYYFEKTRDQALGLAERRTLAERGIAAENEALAINPEYVEALIYKNLLLRVKAHLETDPAAQQALVREADVLRGKALQLGKSRAAGPVPVGTVIPAASVPPPPPPPPPPGAPPASEMKWVYATTDYTAVSGPLPVRTRNVRPIYPPIAVSNGLEGTVILEATVDSRGRVSQVKVVQTQALLTQSAIDAVRQWEFAPGAEGSSSVIAVTADFRKSK